MITCPGCQKTLPDWSQSCQFCGASTAKVVRPVAPPKIRRPMATDAAPWVWVAYYVISVFYILRGAAGILTGVGVLGEESKVVDIVFGSVNALIGLGLLLRLEFIRGIMNVVCFLQMIGAAFGMIAGFFLSPLAGPFAALLLLLDVVQFCAAGLMIFLLGETDKRAPSL